MLEEIGTRDLDRFLIGAQPQSPWLLEERCLQNIILFTKVPQPLTAAFQGVVEIHHPVESGNTLFLHSWCALPTHPGTGAAVHRRLAFPNFFPLLGGHLVTGGVYLPGKKNVVKQHSFSFLFEI